ncbi:MAG: hypothetical protein EBZ67_13070, partial [Chitinophagia bacterium]|nr:hypothetical protein [Chitinophagia bacterium]
MLIPILALVFTGNFRKSYGKSLALSLISLFILALRDSWLLFTANMTINALLKNASLTLHFITAAFF